MYQYLLEHPQVLALAPLDKPKQRQQSTQGTPKDRTMRKRPYGNKEIRFFDMPKFTPDLDNYLSYFPTVPPVRISTGFRRRKLPALARANLAMAPGRFAPSAGRHYDAVYHGRVVAGVRISPRGRRAHPPAAAQRQDSDSAPQPRRPRVLALPPRQALRQYATAAGGRAIRNLAER